MIRKTIYGVMLLVVACGMVGVYFLSQPNLPQDMKGTGAKAKMDGSVYLVKESGDVWRAIILPGSQLGFTVQEVKIVDGKAVLGPPSEPSKSKPGHPSLIADVGEEYIAKVKVVRWAQVRDGNYIVERVRPEDVDADPPWNIPMWTVWSAELFEEVRKTQGW